jgi:hypothetical protein
MRSLRNLILLTAAVAGGVEAATINLSFSSQTVGVGGTFTVTVGVTNVFAAPLDPDNDVVVFFGGNSFVGDGTVVEFVSATNNGLLFDTQDFGGTPQFAGFTLDLGGLGQGQFTEPLNLVTLTFRALALGTTNVGVESDLGDPNQGLQYSTLAGSEAIDLDQVGRVDVVVPEPATLLLLALPLGVIVRRRMA